MARPMMAGAEAKAAVSALKSPETYVGYGRAERFASPGGMFHDREERYLPGSLALNQWSLEGDWVVGKQSARSVSPGAKIHYRFHARDLHLVLGSPGGRPVRFKVTLDGKPPGADAGVDVAPDGSGRVSGERLYQLIRQKGEVRDRTFTIEFLDPGVEAFAFTFG
jgi:hypothetical protein